MKLADLPQVQALSAREKLGLVEELWAEIRRSPDSIPLPDWHVAELERSETEYRANPREGATWDEVKARILRRP